MKEAASLIVMEVRRELEAAMGDGFYIDTNKDIEGGVIIRITDTKVDFYSQLKVSAEVISFIRTLGDAKTFVKDVLNVHDQFPYLTGDDEKLFERAVSLVRIEVGFSYFCECNVRKEPTGTFVDFEFANYVEEYRFTVTVSRNTFDRDNFKPTVRSIIQEINKNLKIFGAKVRCKDPFEDGRVSPTILKQDAPITHKVSYIKPNIPGFGDWG